MKQDKEHEGVSVPFEAPSPSSDPEQNPLRPTPSQAEGDRATVETRRGSITLPVHVVKTIRPDTLFIPYHWPGDKSANQVTIAAQDPISKIPEYKACAARLKKA